MQQQNNKKYKFDARGRYLPGYSNCSKLSYEKGYVHKAKNCEDCLSFVAFGFYICRYSRCLNSLLASVI